MTQYRDGGDASIFIGMRKTGKTSYFRREIEPVVMKDPNKKLLIIDTFDHPVYRDTKYGPPITIGKPGDLVRWKGGKLRIIVEDDFGPLFEAMKKYLWNAVIVWEDYNSYFEEEIPKPVLAFIRQSRMRNNDMIFMTHSFCFAYTDLFRLCNSIELWKTADTPEIRKRYLANYNEVCSVYERIKKNENRFYHEKIDIN